MRLKAQLVYREIISSCFRGLLYYERDIFLILVTVNSILVPWILLMTVKITRVCIQVIFISSLLYFSADFC